MTKERENGGAPVSQNTVDEVNNVDKQEMLLYCSKPNTKSNHPVEAICRKDIYGFTVLSGSHLETNFSEFFPIKLLEKRKNAKVNDQGELEEDVLFTSASYSASFVIGSIVNGRAKWKTSDGILLKDIEPSKRRKTAAIYIEHFGTEAVSEDQDSELQICREFAKDNGYKVTKEYRDYITAKNSKLIELRKVIFDIRWREFSVVLMPKSTVISRNEATYEQIMTLFDEKKIKVVFIDGV